jgi:hypothetical protein
MGKMILIGVTAVTAVFVVAVHYQQQRDRNEMLKGCYSTIYTGNSKPLLLRLARALL